MKNTGVVAVGHILAAKDQKDHLKTLRHFCSVMFSSMGEDMVQRHQGLAHFDKFMSATKANLESFETLIMAILKKQGVDDFLYQLKVENVAWDFVKVTCEEDVRNEFFKNDEHLLFQLFSLFNRFCDPLQLPLRMNGKACAYLLQQLTLRPSVSSWQDSFDFSQFLGVIKNFTKDHGVRAKVDKLHAKLVKNVLVQDNLDYRILRGGQEEEAGRSLKNRVSLGFAPLQNHKIVINHRHLMIEGDHGEILQRVPLMRGEARIRKCEGIFNRRSRFNVIIAVKDGICSILIELVFKAFKDEYNLYKWTEAVRQAAGMTINDTDPLTQIYQHHNIRSSYFHRRQLTFHPQLRRLQHHHRDESLSTTNMLPKEEDQATTRAQVSSQNKHKDGSGGGGQRRSSAPDLEGNSQGMLFENEEDLKLATADDVVEVVTSNELDDSLSDSGVSTSSSLDSRGNSGKLSQPPTRHGSNTIVTQL